MTQVAFAKRLLEGSRLGFGGFFSVRKRDEQRCLYRKKSSDCESKRNGSEEMMPKCAGPKTQIALSSTEFLSKKPSKCIKKYSVFRASFRKIKIGQSAFPTQPNPASRALAQHFLLPRSEARRGSNPGNVARTNADRRRRQRNPKINLPFRF